MNPPGAQVRFVVLLCEALALPAPGKSFPPSAQVRFVFLLCEGLALPASRASLSPGKGPPGRASRQGPPGRGLPAGACQQQGPHGKGLSREGRPPGKGVPALGKGLPAKASRQGVLRAIPSSLPSLLEDVVPCHRQGRPARNARLSIASSGPWSSMLWSGWRCCKP